jgi:hypothetical protein
MPKDLKNSIQIAEFLPVQELTDSVNGSAVDTRLPDESRFDSALIRIGIGAKNVATTAKIKIEEDDDSAFGSASVAEGGEEITVAANTQYKMEITRKKRYLRAVATVTGTTKSVVVYVTGILCDWGKPFPIL